jgi:hypothetical protein
MLLRVSMSITSFWAAYTDKDCQLNATITPLGCPFYYQGLRLCVSF